MNLRKVDNFNIGLDIGTGSVGWVAADFDGEILSFKGKHTWGSRLFPNAEPASVARIPRGQRRRYDRRRQRLNWLQDFFLDEMNEVDPEFFIRLRQARLLPEDREEGHSAYRWPLFNGSDFTERDYYKRFPTIYHLRQWLMTTDEKADIRLIYLAFHNIVKTRGNFLHQDSPKLSAANADMKKAVERFCAALSEWCDEKEIEYTPKPKVLKDIYEDASLGKRDKQEQAAESFNLGKEHKQMAKVLSGCVVGFKVDFAKVFPVVGEGANFDLSNDEAVDGFLEMCPDEGIELFESLQAMHSSFILLGILKNAEGGTISDSKVKEYERYQSDLKTLKDLVKEYAPQQYHHFFRGPFYEGTHEYDLTKADGYTKYNGAKQSMSYDAFRKAVVDVFKGTAVEMDERYSKMMASFEEGEFLRRLKTSDNGSIPYQLHLEEMDTIISNQAKYYPFLAEHKKEIESLVSFRIPYYVGPVTSKNAAENAKGEKRFSWSKRIPGQEGTPIRPWNWEEVIDKHASAQAFIERMTGTCTYLQDEPVLPRCSLLYEKYCVLNELNGASWSQDGDDFHRFDYGYRMDIIEDLFKHGGVNYKKVENWLKQHGHMNPHVKGGQGETGFESKLSSYLFFRNLLDVDELTQQDEAMVENLILWNTLFEDRGILKDEIKRAYGDRLDDGQIKKICKERFTGWGRLSRKFLCGLKVKTDNGKCSIMDVLEQGNPNSGQRNNTMILMEILHDDALGFSQLVDDFNLEHAENSGGLGIDDLPGSPALRRSINQSLKIVREISKIAGKAPDSIFIEVTRDEDERNKGRRTTRRYDAIKNALESLKDEGKANPEVLDDLKNLSSKDLDERLTLYFMQNGKSLYSGQPLDIRRLSEYQVDHIIPQSYIKDDSFENKALVLAEENQWKSDDLLISESIRRNMKHTWADLHEAGLIGDKKYNNLMRDRISDKQLKGFINRQLVETSQIIKFVRMMLEQEYPETKVISIKASLSSQLREARKLVKCREANDYHHAHDAYLACEIGRFLQKRHSEILNDPIQTNNMIRKYVRIESEEYKKTHRMPASSGFIIGSFLRSGFDKETGEIFRDDWDAEEVVGRLRRSLDFKDCFISRMPEETSGAFWDATIYSPKGGKAKPKLRLKKALPCEKYGGYSGEEYAYFYIYRATKGTKTIYRLSQVPISVAKLVKTNENALVDLARQTAAALDESFLTIVKPKIYKKQIIIVNGTRLLITGREEVRNASELAFSLEQASRLESFLAGGDLDSWQSEELYRLITEGCSRFAGELAKRIPLSDLLERYISADLEVQRATLRGLLSLVNGSTNKVDLSGIGGVKTAGQIKINYSKLLSDPGQDFEFIDQSVTGMFERRYKLEL